MRPRYALTQVEPPAAEPVEIDEAKLHLRVDGGEEDVPIMRLISAARRQAESYMGRALMTQTWDMDLDGFPVGTIEVPRPPLRSVASIQYVDEQGATQVLDPAQYRVDAKGEPGRVTPAHGRTWPATRAVANAVTVEFQAGYGAEATNVPEDIRQAILLIVGRLYAHREDVIAGAPMHTLPRGAEHLMGPYRVVRI